MDDKISALPTIPVVDRSADLLYVVDTSAPLSSASTKATINLVLGIAGNPVGTTDTQTLTGKTLTAPALSSPVLSGTLSGTYTLGGSPTFPATVVLTTATQTLTGKTLTAPTISGGSISNTTIAVDAISEFTAANGVTIDGVNLKDGTINTANAVITSSILPGAITPATLQSGTGSTWVWQTYAPTVVNVNLGTAPTTSYKWVQIGKTVIVDIFIALGTSGTVGGGVTVSLPVAAAARYGTGTHYPAGEFFFVDEGAAIYPGFADITGSTTVASLYTTNTTGTFGTNTPITGSVPFTFGPTDKIVGRLMYEAA
jgi:hypothetical protein